jgi:hypothetical protein
MLRPLRRDHIPEPPQGHRHRHPDELLEELRPPRLPLHGEVGDVRVVDDLLFGVSVTGLTLFVGQVVPVVAAVIAPYHDPSPFTRT